MNQKMKASKRLLSFLLCLVMVLGLLPMTAFAADIITGNATVTVPVGGQTPSFTATSGDPSSYSVKVLRWGDVEKNQDIYQSSLSDSSSPYYNYKFIGGKQYSVVVQFTAVGDNTLSYDNGFTINGESTWPTGGDGLKRIYTFTATGETATYIVSFNANGGSGTMADVTGISGSYALPSCTFTAPDDKQFKGWATSADGAVISGTTTNVTSDTTLYAIWEDIPVTTYTVSFDANGGTGTMTAVTGVSGSYTLPANGFTAPAGQQFKGWATSASGAVIIGTSITVSADTELYAIWEPIPATTYTVSFDANGGTGTMTAVTGVSGSYTLPANGFTAPSGKQFKGWATSADGAVISGTTTNVTSDTTLYAIWENIPSGGSSGGGSSVSTTYSVTAGKTENGSVTVSSKSASKGSTVTITVTPDKGYVLETLTVLDKNDKEIKITEKNGKYTFTMPASKVTVKATFMDDNTMLNYFVDVKAGDYFYDAVLWAVQAGITSGTDATHFSPNASCTRAQIVTFLWRAAGSPEPKSMGSFVDVSADSYYAKAVAWAVENGITGGTGDGKFSPNATCTRAQAMTFLYRASGSPAVSGGSAFSDVAATAYYADAVAWAEKNEITGGIGGGLFGSGNNCTRGQIVTFLFRNFAK